jgi:plastocyanin
MAQPAASRLAGPEYLTGAAANLYNPAANTYGVLKHLHFANDDSVAHNVTIYIGATGGSAGGTELFKSFVIAANGTYDWYSSGVRMAATDYLTGLADTASKVAVTVAGEVYAAITS